LGIEIPDSLGGQMSYGDLKNKTFDFVGSWFIGDAYWIVKLAVHPEMANYFKAHRR
jgi:hypothetical protein